jgi:hypothetical protein
MAFCLLGQFCIMACAILSQFQIFIWLLVWFHMIPSVYAAKTEGPFPDISFHAFNQIIESTFGSNISLATVLTLLFTVTENVDLLNLHFRQQHPEYRNEKKTQTTGWMTALAKALIQKLGDTKSSLYFDGEENNLTPKDDAKLVARKLNDLAVNLNLTPYDDQGAYIGKLLPISLKAIQPIHMICPGSLVCGTATCKPRSLVQATQ